MIRSLLLLPIFPRSGARAVQVRPVWWPAVLILTALTVAARVTEWPSVIQSVLAHLPPTASPADQEWVRAVLARELSLRCLVNPLIYIGAVALFGGLLHYMGRAQRFFQRPRYGHLFALVAYAAFIPALAELMTAVLKAWGGIDASMPSLAWLAGVWGVHDFIFIALLEAVSLTALWFIVVLASGLSILFACSFWRSLLFAATAWAIAVLANLWLLRIMVGALHLRV